MLVFSECDASCNGCAVANSNTDCIECATGYSLDVSDTCIRKSLSYYLKLCMYMSLFSINE